MGAVPNRLVASKDESLENEKERIYMQSEKRAFTKSSFLWVLSLVAMLTLTVSVFSQKKDGKQSKPASQSKQEKSGNKAASNPQGNPDTRRSGPPPIEKDCWKLFGEGEDDPRLAYTSGGERRRWFAPVVVTPTGEPATSPTTVSANCGGEIAVTLTVLAKNKGPQYYQVEVLPNSGLVLADTSAQSRVNLLNFTSDCERKTVTIKFRKSQQAVRNPSRQFLLQWMKPIGGNGSSTTTLPAGDTLSAANYRKGKAHLVKIVCQ
ncbi:MAG: hypothetical protein HOP19_13345 [Acidobacteria bacterium]|nr:hypothetical protein [Acidobacteriota bacterium]